MGVGECRDGKSLPTDRESVGRDADRGSRSVPDLRGKPTTDVVVRANHAFCLEVSRNESAPV
jgi:hypothetical protein